MGKITFVSHDGDETLVDIVEGQSLMQLATGNCVPGIDGDCGGEAACGTCHVILESDWFSKSGTPSDDELQMLDLTPERADCSRLSCQITAAEDMDGMTVQLPEFQM